MSAPDEGVSGIDGDFHGDLFAVHGIEGFTVSVGADGLSDNVVGEDRGELWDVLEESLDGAGR